MTPKNLLFVRHAQSIGNVMTQDERAVCGIPNKDYPLTDVGKQQAMLTGKFFKEKFRSNPPDIFFHSTFLRTRMTMDVILQEMQITPKIVPVINPLLDEKWDGIFHELSKSDIEKLYPEQIKLRKQEGYYHRAPRGESGPDVEVRIKKFISDPNLTGKNIFIVGHGRWFMILQKILHNLTAEDFLELKKKGLPNCSVIEYDCYRFFKDLPPIFIPWRGSLSEQNTEFA